MKRLVLPGLLATSLAIATVAIGSSGSMIPEVTGSTDRVSDRHTEILGLDDPKRAAATVEALIARGVSGTEQLANVATTESDLSMRGWAILGLARAKGKLADDTLQSLTNDGQEPQIVRTWAYAAQVNRADDLDALVALQPMMYGHAGAQDLIQKKAVTFLNGADTEELLGLAARFPQLAAGASQELLDAPIHELATVMLTHDDTPTRQAAASWLGAQAQQRNKSDAVAKITVAQLQHDPDAEVVPWKGGALYVPGIQWDRKEARALVRELIRWKLYCEREGLQGERNQVWNNLRSVQLLQSAGFNNRWPNDQQVLEEWARIGGRDDLRKILAEQDMLDRMSGGK